MAFTNPARVQGGVICAGAVTAIVGHQVMMGMIQSIRDGRAAKNDAVAMQAWDRALSGARNDARKLGDLAKVAVVAALDAQDEVNALRAEVARLRRSVDQRDGVIRALAA